MAKPTRITLCSFCGKPQSEVGRMIQGSQATYICNACINLCKEIMDREWRNTQEQVQAEIKLLTPREIHGRLDEVVVGQEHAKRVLSVAVYNHYKRLGSQDISQPEQDDSKFKEWSDVQLEKSNILIIGPTGTGKTLLARALRSIMEEIMLDVMYTTPEIDNAQKIIIDQGVVERCKKARVIKDSVPVKKSDKSIKKNKATNDQDAA